MMSELTPVQRDLRQGGGMKTERIHVKDALGLMGIEHTDRASSRLTTHAKTGQPWRGWVWRRDEIEPHERTHHSQRYVYSLVSRPGDAPVEPTSTPPAEQGADTREDAECIAELVERLRAVRRVTRQADDVARSLREPAAIMDDQWFASVVDARERAKANYEQVTSACLAYLVSAAPRLLGALARQQEQAQEVILARQERDEMEACWREAESQLEKARAELDRMRSLGESSSVERSMGSTKPRRPQYETRVLVIGGATPSSKRMEKLEARLGSHVEWLPTSGKAGVRVVQSAANRVRSGRYYAVVMTRFANHSDEDAIRPACEESETPYGRASEGAGTDAIVRAYERAMGARSRSPAFDR
jgi:hypothetical protein